ncbi:MAG TPA: dockerin type I domain-containing protein [Phycisphaerales bacterium]|nr:dockerin type I domain-containing protein [Phycisphaerales bacterium]
MVLVMQQNYCVYVAEHRVNYCQPILGPMAGTRRWWKHFLIPAGAPTLAPNYYASPEQCNCATNTTYPNPNPSATQPAPTLAPLPSRTQRPWNPGTDGTPPNPDGTWPTQGPPMPGPAAVEFRLDLGDDFKGRKLTSALDLNLYECRIIAGALYDELRQPGPHAGSDTPTTIRVTPDIRLTGTLGSIIKQLRQFASDRVHSKAYGDFDGDGERHAADFTILQDMVMTPPTEESDRRKYDLDGDDQLTSNDLVWWTEINAL